MIEQLYRARAHCVEVTVRAPEGISLDEVKRLAAAAVGDIGPATQVDPSGRHRKITPDDVRAIRAMRVAGHTFAAIGETYGISAGQARLIATGRCWADVE